MKPFLGTRIRERRRTLGITQVSLADSVGISASYLNLIEHNKRSVAGILLVKIAQALELGLDDLDGASERRLLVALEEIAHIPDITAIGVEGTRANELIGRFPGWARAIASLARSHKEAIEVARVLSDRLTHDALLEESIHRMLSAITAIRSASEILVDNPAIDVDNRIRFHEIIQNESRNLSQTGEALASYFDKADVTEKILTPQDEVEALFEQRQNRFEEIENAVDQFVDDGYDTRYRPVFEKALVMAEQHFSDQIADIISSQPQIETEMATAHAYDALKIYTARAILVPMKDFAVIARDLKYDAENLAHHFSVDFETVCHRLTALPHNEETPRFGYFLANAAGTIISLRSIPGLTSPRYSSACPLWVLYRAQQSPESIIRQHVLFPSGAEYVFLARARHLGPGGFGKPRHYLTDMLATTTQDAAYSVYLPDASVNVERVGTSCRICSRRNCQYRVADPLAG